MEHLDCFKGLAEIYNVCLVVERGLEKLEAYGLLSNSFLIQYTGQVYISYCHHAASSKSKVVANIETLRIHFPLLVPNESLFDKISIKPYMQPTVENKPINHLFLSIFPI